MTGSRTHGLQCWTAVRFGSNTCRYDAQGAADDMAQAGLPQGYRDGLLSGYWPSEDVLPADLRVPSSARG